ncbi:alpha-amylase family glycosyl hydrolase [Flavobacterium sp.]|jgi:1,4-alpha-glucan branching enzyme|uniref:alpha-amylase family glycosyl hydrolase n=1 Tax=Flavobacterium sp. TaxID=239 RepID=UPI0037BECD5D
MKKIYSIVIVFLLVSIHIQAQVTTVPTVPEANAAVTINFNKTGTPLSTYNGVIYAHIGVTVNGQQWQNVIGSWGNNTTQPALTLVSGSNYTLSLTPDLFTKFGVPTSSSITQICVVFRAAAGSPQTVDYFLNVGAFQANLVSPATNSTSILSSGSNLAISANNTNGNANYNLLANGTSIHTFTGSTYSYTDSNITTNKNYELQISQGATTLVRKFSVVVNPGTVTQAIPAGLQDGINYNSSDPTKATLVLDAFNKDFIYVAGSFNNWQPNTTYAMKKDPSSTKFWLELTGLTPGQIYTYQYWVVKQTPIANSPALVKVADPYSTLVLSPFDDPGIPASSFPNLPAYPQGQEREVTVLQTGQTPYAWSAATTNFVKPKKEDLVVYEVLVRDFDANRNYQDLINKIDYFKNLKVNAIQLMPVMEFEGNESWGYNTAFHMALDKFYGTPTKFKEFVDLCHQNGIAVILDLALNHAFGRNSLTRMWMNDPDGDGWGGPSAENPYFNQSAMHSYNVGDDFNHQQPRTKNYTKRVIDHWINEYKIDGFRWDLTKGFTQNCPSNVAGGQENCTNQTQADRVAVLKDYADHSWLADPNHYVIFEHLGSDSEEKQWADYRLNEGKGIMLWGKMTNEYNQLSMGFASNASINRAGHVSRNFLNKRLMAYAESHDEERLMYKNLQFGNNSQAAHNVRNLNVALSRMSAIGAVLFTIPGPKMIWHFGALGMENSIFTCTDGTFNDPSATLPGDCKLSTKPQPQWVNNWLGNVNRVKIYNDWAKLISLKVNEPVFEGSYTISPEVVSGSTDNLRQRIYVFDTSLPETSLKNVVVLANFATTAVSINPNFPFTGEWYDLMDNSAYQVNNTATPISIPPGQFRIFGNKQALLSSEDLQFASTVTLAPNPTTDFFTLNSEVERVEVYSLTGQLVKSFTKTYSIDYQYDVNDLNTGIYLVKAINENNQSKTMKLVKK